MNRDKASRDKASRDNETQDLEGSHFHPQPLCVRQLVHRDKTRNFQSPYTKTDIPDAA
jgi:hypothetical protein